MKFKTTSITIKNFELVLNETIILDSVINLPYPVVITTNDSIQKTTYLIISLIFNPNTANKKI